MKKLIVLAIICLTPLSCQNHASTDAQVDTENMTEAELEEVLEKTDVTYSHPIYADSSNYIMIPLAHESTYDKKDYTSIKSKRKNLPTYWNIIFYNKISGKTHLLTQDKIGIQQIYVQEQQQAVNHNTIPNKILYEIDDHAYHKKDQSPSYLFSSNLDGSDFKQISPKNEAVVYFEIIPSTQAIFLQTVQDVNQDSLYNHEDKNILYKATLDKNEWQLNEILPAAERSQIQKMYLEQWQTK